MYSPSLLAYAVLGLLLIGALASVVLGLRPRLQRILQGRDEGTIADEPRSGFLGRAYNADTFVHRALRTERLPAALTQGLRDLFGAHTYGRIDADPAARFHTLWSGDHSEIEV